MKKGIKLLLGTLISIIVLIVIYIILVLFGVAINPFLDTKDLVCTRIFLDLGYTSNEVVNIKFNKKAIVEKIDFSEEVVFEEAASAQTFYVEMQNSIGEDWQKHLTIEGNKVIIVEDVSISTKEEPVTKKQIKKDYEDSLYECK